MMSRRLDLNDIRLLMQVVEHGSYTSAARATGVPKSTISQRIAALEQTVGTGLLRRTSRSFSLTEAGTKLLPHARAIAQIAHDVEQCVLEDGDELQGTLRVSSPTAIAQVLLSPLVPKFLARHEQVTIRIDASNRTVDLVTEGYDLTVRAHVGPLSDSSLRQRVVARVPWSLAASPQWLAEHGSPEHPGQIPGDRAICLSTASEGSAWTLRRGEDSFDIDAAPRLVSDDMTMLRTSAIAGGGVTCLPLYLLREAVANGQLILILPEWSIQTSDISLLSPPRAQSSRLASEFSSFLAAEAPRLLN